MLKKEINPKDALGVKKPPSSTASQAVAAEVGVAMLEGALKFGRHNYRATHVLASVYYDALRRHIDAWWEGQDLDPDSGLSHVTKAIATLMVLRDAQICGSYIDDRPPPVPESHWELLRALTGALHAKYPNPVAPCTSKTE